MLGDLRQRFQRCANDEAALQELNLLLRGVRDEGGVDLQCEVMARLRVLRRGVAAPPNASAIRITRPVLAAVLADHGLDRPDGRPLYRYRLGESRRSALQAQVEQLRRASPERADPEQAAVFVLYAADRFNQVHEGGGYAWERVVPGFAALGQEAFRKPLALDGLAWWGRAPRRIGDQERRLMTLVLEGGFPTRLLHAREAAPVSRHLRGLIGRIALLSDPTFERVYAASRADCAALGAFDNDDFHALCAELTVAVASLRRDVEANAPSGAPAVAWLDVARQGWRDGLPITLADDAARVLIEDLVSGRLERIAGGEAGCERLLVLNAEGWRPALRVGLDGELRLSAAARVDPAEGRLRAYAAGALASQLTGELAILEPPAEPGQGWQVRGRGPARVVTGFPDREAARIALRCGSEVRALVDWPGGGPVRGELRVYADARGEGAEGPADQLTLIGTGSLRTRRRRVYVLAPQSLDVRSAGEGAHPPHLVWRGGGQALFSIEGAAYVGPPGACYRIEPGADGELARSLILDGPRLRGAEPLDPDRPVYLGAPAVKLRQGASTRAPGAGQVRWRRSSDPIWRDWAASPPSEGSVELTWRDPVSNDLLQRERFTVLPPAAELRTSPLRGGATFRLQGAPGWSLDGEAPGAACAADADGGLRLSFAGRPSRRATLTLHGPHGGHARAFARVPIAGGGFSTAGGALLPGNARVMFDDLRGLSAFADGRSHLFVTGPCGSEATVPFDDELALWSLSDMMARLMSTGSELDESLVLELGRIDRRKLQIGRYAAQTSVRDGLVEVRWSDLIDDAPAENVTLEWLSLCRPHDVRTIAVRGWSERDSRAADPLPDDLPGPGLVIVRLGERSVGRPSLALGRAPVEREGLGPIALATLDGDHARRVRSMEAALAGLGEDTAAAAADRSHLFALIDAGARLPASAFDALKLVASQPRALAILAADATEAQRPALWKLERESPFLWALVSREAWLAAFAGVRERLSAQMRMGGIAVGEAQRIAGDSVRGRAKAWVDIEPLLQVPFRLAEVGELDERRLSFREACEDRIRRAGDLDEAATGARPGALARPSVFRRADSPVRDLLPDLSRFDPSQWEGLDAAPAAALVAADKVAWPPRPLILRIRTALAEEPLSFADAYAACLFRLAQDRPLSL